MSLCFSQTFVWELSPVLQPIIHLFLNDLLTCYIFFSFNRANNERSWNAQVKSIHLYLEINVKSSCCRSTRGPPQLPSQSSYQCEETRFSGTAF